MSRLCALCHAVRYEPGLWEDHWFKILETKDRKGHQRRIMIASFNHTLPGPSAHSHMLDRLEDEGRKAFAPTYKFVILDGTYGSLPDHPHYVATDLDPQSEDFEQILGTPWLRVVQVREWKDRPA